MRRASATVWAPVMTSVLLLSVLGCSRTAEQAIPVPGEVPVASPAVQFAEDLRRRVTVDAMRVHLSKLQGIADQHGGNRAVGTPGYDASVEYAAGALRGGGVRCPDPRIRGADLQRGKPTLTVVAVRRSTPTP